MTFFLCQIVYFFFLELPRALHKKYYKYVLLYTNDVLVISNNREKILHEGIGKYFELKENSIGPPKIYLGGHMS